jgi:DoxX-like family
MRATYAKGPTGAGHRLTGTILSGIAVLFLLFDSLGKLLRVAPVVEGTAQLGYPDHIIRPIGIILLICVVTYVTPRTAILGAVLLTGYMGGAIATHVRVGSPLLTHVLFPVYVSVLVWGGLFLRDLRLRHVLIAPS